jgi:hypothetical protein
LLQEKAAVESRTLQAKQRYNNAVSEYQTAAMDLDDESKKLRAVIARSQYKFFNIQGLLGAQMRQQKMISASTSRASSGTRFGEECLAAGKDRASGEPSKRRAK